MSREYKFWGHEWVSDDIKELYDDFSKAWCAETCAPRMRCDWSEDNKTLGQCSITSFIVQDLLGGKVYGVHLGDGVYHCFNEVDGIKFDLTSEQFGGETLCYDGCPEQLRENHLGDPDKKARYELLKERFEAARSGK